MRTLLQDLRFGARMLRKEWGFTAVALLTLATAIGTNTAIFSVVDGVLLRDLPFREPDALVAVFGTDARRGTTSGPVSPPDFEDWKASAGSFEALSAYSYWTFNLTGSGEPERILGARTSGDMLSVLGTRPVVGRLYTPEDDRPGAEPVAVIGYGLWQRRFGGDPAVVGRALTFNGVSTTIVGVLPADFRFPDATMELWAPIAGELEGTPRNARMLSAVGRLRQGATAREAQAEMAAVAARLEAAFPDSNTGRGVRVVPLHDTVVGDVRPALLLLQTAVGLVLLVACANVANLLLARGAARRQELAIRAALGARRHRLVSQLLSESLLLALLGGALGVLVAVAGVQLIAAVGPSSVPRLDEVRVDRTVLGFALALTLATGLVMGLAPALPASRADVGDALKAGRTKGGSARTGRLRGALVATEIALSVVLLVGGGLFVGSFARVLDVDLGFRHENVLTMQVLLTGQAYREIPRQKAYVGRALERIAGLPGVEAAASVTQLPLGGPGTTLAFLAEGRDGDVGDAPSASYRAVSPGYFDCLEIPILRGRAFTAEDNDRAPLVLVANEAAARSIWPGEDPVGKRIRWAAQGSELGWHTIVGVVGDVRTAGPETPEAPAFYAPYAQRSIPFMRWTALAVRTSSEPRALEAAVRAELLAVDPDQPVYDVRTMDELLGDVLARRRFAMLLVSAMAAVALLLATVGLYGVVSYSTAMRTREIGIRMALGARRGHVFGLVLREGAALVVVGAAVGLAGAAALSGVVSGLVFGMSATDPRTFAGAALLLGIVSLVACAMPARRATKVDPAAALRAE